MRTLRDLPIKQKLLAITGVTVAVSLLLAGVGFVISDSILFRNSMKNDIAALASIVGDNSTAALAFDVPSGATEVLSALKAKPYIVAACIYKNTGLLFARYPQSAGPVACDPPAAEQDIRFTSTQLVASHPILLNGGRMGTLVMHYDLGEYRKRTQVYLELVLLILVASSLIAFLFSSRLRDIIAAPLSRLAGAAAAVSQTGDYSVRVDKDSQDELGVLVDSFNEMLARVQSRDIEVQNARYSLQTTLTSISDAVISTDTAGHIVFVNPAAQSLLRRPEQELLGGHIDRIVQIIHELTRQRLELPVHAVLRDGAIAEPTGHTLLVAADGTEIPIDNSAAPIRDAHGKITGVVLIFRDISGRRATEKVLESQASELKQKADQLREADERKDQFLAMLAHELRNPLAPIRNAVEVLKTIGEAGPNQRWAGEVIERQTRHLARLVDDLLDVSRITRGKVTLKTEPLDLTTIIQNAVEMSRPIIDARGQHLTVTLPEKSVGLKGDMTRLVQVVGNLLNNAAKFTDAGGAIRLRAEQTRQGAVITVSDNGIGLSPGLLPHVFDLFTQADRSLDRSQGGLGIGLTLVRTLVELHGGTVEARSEGTGRGSEFVVRLPASTTASVRHSANIPDQPQSSDSGGLRILILEDNKDSAEILRYMLQLDGHLVNIAFEGSSALQAALNFQPQVVLCDIGLPGMNGYEVAMQLRAHAEFRQTRLIAVSGYGQEEDQQRSRDAGFDYHLTKPVEPETLSALLATIFTMGQAGRH